jgi:dipeptidyl aminopeptidase/acylaminoacyl peptidase
MSNHDSLEAVYNIEHFAFSTTANSLPSSTNVLSLDSRQILAIMSTQPASFQTLDQTTLRGLFYTPTNYSGQKLPCVVLSHGFSATKDQGLTAVAEHLVANLPITALVFDNRGFGESDAGVGRPRLEVDGPIQMSDISDAITYAQTRPEVDPTKIGIWGSSFSGGSVLWVAAIDRRVKAVVSQAPLVDGFSAFANLLRSDDIADWEADFQKGQYGTDPLTHILDFN